MSTPQGERVPETTGRSVVVLSDAVRGDRDAIAAALRSLADIASVVGTADDPAGLDPDAAAAADAIAFDASASRSSRAIRAR